MSPLRGSEIASGWAGRIGSMLVNSVDTLAPNNRFVKADFRSDGRRHRVFDNDGTLWSEQPMYFQLEE